MRTHVNKAFNLFPHCTVSFRREGGWRWFLGRSTEDMVEQYLSFFQCFMVSISGGVRRFVPMVIVVERGDATSVWHWKGLPTRTPVFEKQKCGPGHKSSREHIMVMCSGNTSRNHKLNVR
jgi:hypothetical protein